MQFDLADAFNQIDLAMALRKFFSLPAVEKRELRSRPWKGCRLTTRLPSSLSSGLCRWDGRMHLPFARPSFLGSRVSPPALEENQPAPRFDVPVLSVHVDNFATIGTNAAHVGEVGNAVLSGATGIQGASPVETLARELVRILHACSRDLCRCWAL